MKQRTMLKMKGRSRLEVLQAVCREMGGSPPFFLQGRPIYMSQESGPRTYLVTFAEPFEVRIEEIKEHFSDLPTGTMRLVVFAAGLPESVGAFLYQQRDYQLPNSFSAGAAWQKNVTGKPQCLGIEVVDLEAEAADGRNLYHRENQPFYPTQATFGSNSKKVANWLQLDNSVPLKNLFRDVDRIARFRGRIRVGVPSQVVELNFPKLTVGASQQAGALRFTLQRVALNAAVRVGATNEIDVACQGLQGQRIRWMAWDRTGKSLEGGEATPTNDRLVRLRFLKPTTIPERLSFKILKVNEEVSFPFEFRDLPLMHRPEREVPLEYPGQKAPATLDWYAPDRVTTTLRSYLQRQLDTVTLRNYSQKPIERIRLKLTYLDEAGKPLGEWLHTKADLDTSKNRLRILVNPGSQVIFPVDDPTRPARTKKVVPTVLEVGFADATNWAPPPPKK